MDSHQADATAATVLIVGTGPAGLFAACELLRHGVRPRIVEPRLEPHHQARGTALQPLVLEMLDRAGLIDPFLHASVRIRHQQVLGPGLRELASTNLGSIGGTYPIFARVGVSSCQSLTLLTRGLMQRKRAFPMAARC